MRTRRDFLKASAAGIAAVGLSTDIHAADLDRGDRTAGRPFVISTWRHGLAANEAAWRILSLGGSALDAVETGARVSESDPELTTVGLGGLPDRDGHVTLDACIMNERGDCGSTAFLQQIEHPVSVARLVMEKTPHVMLVGEGALQFALANGFQKKELLTPAAKEAWQRWLAARRDAPSAGPDNHDTLGILAMDAAGDLSGACTTSGVAYKLHGRVGDSPIIGAALYVDNEVGAACTTGLGELVMRTLTSFLTVELMRSTTPQAACEQALRRTAEKNDLDEETQVACLAADRDGRIGAAALVEGFSYAVHDRDGNHLVSVPSLK